MSDQAELTAVQTPAHLAFWYDSEVQNGGHLQYFLNRGIGEAHDALDALVLLGADAQRGVLAEAIEVYDRSNISHWQIESVDDHCNLAPEGHFGEQDAAYYICTPEMPELLQRYLDSHTMDFIEFTDEPVRDRHEPPWHVRLRIRIRRFFGLMP